jgi:hypothetical protein
MTAKAIEANAEIADAKKRDWFPLVAYSVGGAMVLVTIAFWVAIWVYVVPHLTMKAGFVLVTLGIGLAFIVRGVTLKSGRRTAWGPTFSVSYIVTGAVTLLLDVVYVAT